MYSSSATRRKRRSATRTRSRAPVPKHTIYATHPLFPFFFVGCWNKDSAGQAQVATKMQTLLPRPTSIFIGGDNVYPDKTPSPNPRKVYSHERLRRGFHQMQSLNVPMYVALGNHNIADPSILSEELALGWTIPNNYYCVRFAKEKIQIVVLDTNLYSEAHASAPAVDGQAQEAWLDTILASPKYKSIIIQHEPLAGYKKKKDATYVMLPRAMNLLAILSRHKPLAVLSADIHNYQDLTIDSGIRQIIVGTGGAQLDLLPSKMDLPWLTVAAAESVHGFLRVNAPDNYEFIRA